MIWRTNILRFDHSGVGSVGVGGEQFVEDLVGDALAGVDESARAKARVAGGGSPSGPEGSG